MNSRKEELQLYFEEFYDWLKKREQTNKRKKWGEIVKSLSKEILEDLYYTQNKSLQDIANQYDCTRVMIHKLMKKYGLERRRRSKARVLALKKGKFKDFEYHEIDEKFFSKWSPEMAWVLGLLFTDGCIHPVKTRMRVALHSVDFGLLEQVKHLLKSTRPIKKQIQSYDSSKHIYKLEFYREKMIDDLNKLGLIQAKSLKMKFPDVPEEYMRHFIRGCWDGDGSVYLQNGRVAASFTCGSKQFIEKLVEELYKIGIEQRILRRESKNILKTKLPLRAIRIHKSKGRNAFYIKLFGENCRKLFHYFYDNVDESLYLKRKYKCF